MRRKHGTDSDGVSEEAAFELGVVYSAVKDELVAFAAKEGSPYSFADVAARVAKLLQAEALREQLRHSEYLQEMRQNGAGHYRGRPPKSRYDELGTTSEIFAGSSAGRPLKRRMSAAGRKAIREAQRQRWAKVKQAQRDREAAKQDLRGSPEAKAKQQKSMQKYYRDPKWRKAMLKRLAAMRARRKGKPKPMSEATKAKLRAARYATLARKRGEAA